MEKLNETRPVRERVCGHKSSFQFDTRLIYCGDNLEQLKKLPGDCCVNTTDGTRYGERRR